jgi:exodeoxyribonuclease VIII
MQHAEYERVGGINWSTLKLVATSPLLARYRAEHPAEDSAHYRLGRAIHCLILEPQQWSSRYAIYSDSAQRRGKAWDAWCEANPGIDALTPAEGEAVARAARAVREHREASRLVDGGRAEVLCEWTDPTHAVQCKGRLDYLKPGRVVDVKTTSKPDRRSIERDIWNYCYHGQLAWYHDGAINAGLLPPDADRPALVVTQTVEPYDCLAFVLGDEAMERGRDLYRSLLTTWCECSAARVWPGMAPDLLTLEPPPWAAGNVNDNGGEW